MNPDLSPWELVILENYKDNNSVLLMKSHHVLGDGLSMVSQVSTQDGDKPEYYSLKKSTQWKFYIMYSIGVIFSAYYTLRAMCRKVDIFSLHGPECSGIKYSDFTEPRPL
jgi:hypothetical protein